MNKQEIEELLKDRLKDVQKEENISYRDYFIRNLKQKLSDESTFKDVKKASELYKRIGEQIRHLLSHFESALKQVKTRLRRELQECQKFNWVQHILNDTIEELDEDRLEEILDYYLDEKDISDDQNMETHRLMVKKCERKFDEFRVTAYENLEKMLSQVFMKFQRVSPLQQTLELNAPSVALAPYSENCFFLLNNAGQTVSIRDQVSGQVEGNLEKTFSSEINAFVVVEPTQILLRDQDSGEVSNWNTLENQIDQMNLPGASYIAQIQVLEADLLAFTKSNSVELTMMRFDKDSSPEFFEHAAIPSEYQETKECSVRVIDFIQFEKNKKAYLAASYDDGFVRIFKRGAKDDKHTEVKKLKRGGAGNVLSLTLVNENELAGAGDDRDSTIEIWRLGNLEEEGSGAADAPAQFFRGHVQKVLKLFMLSPHLVVSAGDDNSVRIWNARSGTQLREFRFPSQITDVYPTKDSIIVSTSLGTLHKIF